MSTLAPHVPAHLLGFQPIPTRLIGKMPVFEDEHGEFVLLDVKVYGKRTNKVTEIQVKVDAEITAIRNLYELTLSCPIADIKKSKENGGTLGYIIHKVNGHVCQAGEYSLPAKLFGNIYHYARHSRSDGRDFRKSAFNPIVK